MQLKHRKRHRLLWLLLAPIIIIAIVISTRYRSAFPTEPSAQRSER